MKKISTVAQNRLFYQASEANDLGLTKLAEAIEGVLYNNELISDEENFSKSEMEDYIYHSLWRNASSIMAYYNVNNPDSSKIEESVKNLHRVVIAELEKALDVKEDLGPFEPTIPGEEK